MTVRPVVHYPAAVLKAAAEPLEPGDEAVRLAQDLVDTMRASPACVGLAAPQIGHGVRAFAIDVTGHPKARSCAGLVVMINPVVVTRGGRHHAREGCMSLPDFTGNVVRAATITVAGRTPAGEELTVAADAFEARALQHEIDHLDGLLFLDRLESVSSDLFRRKRYSD